MTAASSAETTPPMQATPTAAARKSRVSLVRLRFSASATADTRSSMVSPTGSSSPATGPPSLRANGRPRPGTCRPLPRPARSWVTMWTSMSPDSATTVSPTPRAVNSRAGRARLLTPTTSWVAFSTRANSRSAEGTWSPTTV